MKVLSSLAFELLFIFSSIITFFVQAFLVAFFCFSGVGMGLVQCHLF